MIIKRQNLYAKADYEGLSPVEKLKLKRGRRKIAKNLKDEVRREDKVFYETFNPILHGNTNPEAIRAFQKVNKDARVINRKIALEKAGKAAGKLRKSIK